MDVKKEYDWIVTKGAEVNFDNLYAEYLEGLKENYWDYCNTEDEKIHEAVEGYIAGFDDDIYYTMPYSIVEEIEKDFKEYLPKKE